MKTKIFAALVLVILVSGCARFAPNMISTDVYSSSGDAIVAEDKASEAKAVTTIKNEKMVQEIAEEWKKVAIAEVKVKQSAAGASSPVKIASIDKEGVTGGFSCLFINEKTYQDKILTAKKIGGMLNGQKFKIPLNKNDRVVFELPAGLYQYWYTVGNNSYVYPQNGPATFEVTIVPHYFDLTSNTNYHGGVRLFGDY